MLLSSYNMLTIAVNLLLNNKEILEKKKKMYVLQTVIFHMLKAEASSPNNEFRRIAFLGFFIISI